MYQKFQTFYLEDWVQSWQKLAPSGQKIKYILSGRNIQLPVGEYHDSAEGFNFLQEDWARSSTSSGLSCQKTEFEVGR